jgi:hypothetical protein
MLTVLRRAAAVWAWRRAQWHLLRTAARQVGYSVSPWRRAAELTSQRLGNRLTVLLALAVSTVVHMWALLLFGLLPAVERRHDPLAHETVFSAVEPQPEPEPEEVVLDLARPDEMPHDSVLSVEAMSIAPIEANDAELLEIDPATSLDGRIAVLELTPELRGVRLDELVLREGGVGEATQSVEGAVDRLTYEIARHLEQKDVLVVWLMDASLSLVEDRQNVADRLQRVYDELDRLGTVRSDALLNAVVAFGQQMFPMVDPTEDRAAVIDAMRNVPVDDSGIENVFSTVIAVADRYQPRVSRQRRKMLIIVWTDESGNDYLRVDEAIARCRRLDATVYVVGPSAMFGQERGYRPYVHPEDGRTYQLPLDRGPDSIRQERIELPYWFAGEQLRSFSSGLAPFALARLTLHTGGAYFIRDPEGSSTPYDLKTMLRYAPEYTSVQGYLQAVSRSPLRQAVLQAVEITRSMEFPGTPRLEFEPTGATYAQELLDAQKSVARAIPLLEQALAPFGPKGLEAAYEAERSPRWRAWYDYTRGRLLAMRVRAYEYNQHCAQLKGRSPEFVDQKSNRWRFVPDAKLVGGTQSERDAQEAIRLLSRCIEQNPGTPWADMAQRELQYPFGFKVVEAYVAPPPPPPPRPAANVNVPPPPPRPPDRTIRTEQPLMLERPKPVVLPKL